MENTKTQKTQSQGNTKLDSSKLRCRKWCFTLNNYTEEEYTTIEKVFIEKGWTYVIGKEVGESGTPHLQGFIKAKNAVSFEHLKKIMPKAHLEKARGNVEENLNYCSKDGNATTNIKKRKPLKDPLKEKILKPFQEEIIELIEQEPDERKIYWYWDENGNTGKTSLAKHLCLTKQNEVLFVGGKGSDIKYGVKSFLDNPDNELNICIFHFTRSVENFISYEALESIKDGIFYNTKYESGMVIFNPPHIICFANFEPNLEKLSKDRWIIKKIEQENTNMEIPIEVFTREDNLASSPVSS